jgi:hypothetical protein
MATVSTGTPALVATACGQLANACLAVALDVRFAQAHAMLAYPKQPVMADGLNRYRGNLQGRR